MMISSRFLILAVLLLVAFVIGCSGGGNVTTPSEENKVAVESPGNTACLGLWQVVIDKASGNIDVADIREGNLILNVLGFLEPPALAGMTIDFGTLIIDEVNETIEVDVILTHPIPDPVFMGFDVRGVVFGPEIANADGLTVIPSPEFFSGEAFGYQDGLLGTPDSVANYAGLAGYKYFCDGLGVDDNLATFFSVTANLDDRGVFSEAPTTHSRHYILNWVDSDKAFFVFNYAIYANYDWPIGDPVDSVDDFSITTANSQEAFCGQFTVNANTLYYSGGSGGGTFDVDIKVWDWQGIDDVAHAVEFWSDDLGVPTPTGATYTGPGAEPYTGIWNCDGSAGAWAPTEVGFATLYVKVIDPMTFGESWFLNLLSTGNSLYGDNIYNVFAYELEVIECPPAGVTAISPNCGKVGASYNDVSITGTFMTGPSLAVKLAKTGQTDVIATDVKFVSGTNITCDFNLTGVPGVVDWDVVVTNGCGTQGVGVGLYDTLTNAYFTSFDAAESEAANWSRHAMFWHCHWFDNGTINSDEATCAHYGEGYAGDWYAWRTNGITIPTCWTTTINLRINHSWVCQEGYWEGVGVQYSTNGSTWNALNFSDHAYGMTVGTYSYWSGGFATRNSNANLTGLVAPGGTIWIRFDQFCRDGYANTSTGWTIYEMQIS